MNSRLLHGKDDTKRVVALEVNDGHIELFVDVDGEIKSEFISNKHWFLSDRPHGDGWIRLKDDQYYKWGKQFETRSEWKEERSKLYKKDLFVVYNEKEQAMINKGITYFKGMSLDELSVLSFDLETTGLNPDAPDALIVLISTTFRSKKLGIIKRLFSYDEFDSQAQMIDVFCAHVRELNPTIMLGHNINSFDLQYLKIMAHNNGTDLYLGRDGSAARFEEKESKFRKEATQFIFYKRCHIYGREIVDTMFLAVKHDVASRKYISYGLKQIIKQEGLEKPERVMYDASKIRVNYKNAEEMIKIKAYCEDDADDSLALFDLMCPSQFFLATYISMPFQRIIESASGSQLNNMMVRAYLQDARSIPKASDAIEFEGALSDGYPGIYKNAYKLDVSSLYPSLMLQYKIFNKKKDTDGYLIEILRILRDERLKNKKLGKTNKFYDDLQTSQKILINSLYGFLGASGLNYNYPEGAAEITRRGREVLLIAIKWATGKDYMPSGIQINNIDE